ncbi:hypothetical protein DFH06DRAFT_1296343 [Mycena polygramma]|nr:hypothetical protein DFH06DRAFT_1296343 [Mycena polygramma]
MSDAPAAPVTEIGAPPVTEEKPEVPGVQVFVGNLAYSTTDEGLEACFAPVQSDVYVASHCAHIRRHYAYEPTLTAVHPINPSRPAWLALRLVALATAEAAQNAVKALNNKELDGRQVVVEIAKPSVI